MLDKSLSWAALLVLAACSGNPIGDGTDTGGGGGGGGPVDLPGTVTPTANSSVTRYEAQTSDGNGYVSSVSYNAGTDTFVVDGLAFDGDNTYTRDSDVPSLGAAGTSGPFQVYEAPAVVPDGVTGVPITQLNHRAIRGASASGRSQFAIARTGAYVGYGFGGFVYSRTGGVTLPTTGQANYTGDYAALRDFNGRGGLEYATGSMTLDIDFEDFNVDDAVKGSIFNRQIFDIAGNNITATVLTALETENGLTAGDLVALPSILFKIGPGAISATGEVGGNLSSSILNGDGVAVPVEDGKYYAVISGVGVDQEVVGVIVVSGDDPRFGDGVTVRETGGFILYR